MGRALRVGGNNLKVKFFSNVENPPDGHGRQPNVNLISYNILKIIVLTFRTYGTQIVMRKSDATNISHLTVLLKQTIIVKLNMNKFSPVGTKCL